MTDRELTSRAEKAFSFAQEVAKQQITLATGVVALTLTFLKDIAPEGTCRTPLEIAWVLYVLSVIAGVVTLMSLTGNLERPAEEKRDSIYSGNIRVFAGAQAILFLLALIFTVVFGFGAA